MSSLNVDDDKTGSGQKSHSAEAHSHDGIESYFMRVEPPKVNYSTIIIKPRSRGKAEAKKDSLSQKAKEIKESAERSLHIDNERAKTER
jgi:hypothetical protein